MCLGVLGNSIALVLAPGNRMHRIFLGCTSLASAERQLLLRCVTMHHYFASLTDD
jgi:hypothetical protein